MWRFTVGLILAAGVGLCWCGTSDGAALSEGNRLADEPVFERAMEADLAGDTQGRETILTEALQQSPADAAIRWQAGYLMGADGKWYTIEQFCDRQEANPDLAAYRETRDRSGGSLADHLELAHWCLRNHLPLQERFHWLAVLQIDPAHAVARKRLKVRSYQGQILSHQQAAELKSRYRTQRHNLEKWRPRVKRWLKDLQANDTYRQLAAMETIRDVSDPAAIPALVAAFRVAGGEHQEPSSSDQQRRQAVQRSASRTAVALVAAMGSIPEHDATLFLVDQAVNSPCEELRQVATDQLEGRRLTDFVPMLISNMHLVDTSTYGQPAGSVDRFSGGQLFVETFDATYSLDYYRWASPLTARDAGVTSSEVAQDEAEVRKLESVSRAWSARAQKLNPRIHAVLAQLGGDRYTSDPRECWDAWRDYNELSKPTNKPEYSYTATAARYAPATCECFVAGTPVWTLTGPQAIETIVAGDHVLSQDPGTGELAYKCVLDTTYREPNPTVRIDLENETIVATRGHRFWESGYGWRMAKFLDAGMRLSGTAGSLAIERVGPGEAAAAFNLVVEDFHTYFVGRSRLLVHDNGCPQPTLAILPGWQPRPGPMQP